MTDARTYLAGIKERAERAAGFEMTQAEKDRAKQAGALLAVLALAEQWQENFPYKAESIRAAIENILGGGE